MKTKPEKKRLFIPTIIDEIKNSQAHGSFMLPWPGIQCNFDVGNENVDPDLNVADVKPMADRLLAFMESDEPLMPFLAPYLPGMNYLTRWGAQHVWAIMPGWGKTRPRPQSETVELGDAATGHLIDKATGLPVVIKRNHN